MTVLNPPAITAYLAVDRDKVTQRMRDSLEAIPHLSWTQLGERNRFSKTWWFVWMHVLRSDVAQVRSILEVGTTQNDTSVLLLAVNQQGQRLAGIWTLAEFNRHRPPVWDPITETYVDPDPAASFEPIVTVSGWGAPDPANEEA